MRELRHQRLREQDRREGIDREHGVQRIAPDVLDGLLRPDTVRVEQARRVQHQMECPDAVQGVTERVEARVARQIRVDAPQARAVQRMQIAQRFAGRGGARDREEPRDLRMPEQPSDER
ncbi:hypothetical protein GCM10027188_17400 [Lysobacter humi (ex Lee et al. 2017)]